MEAVADLEVVDERDQAVEDVTLAAWCAATVLITAEGPSAVDSLAKRIHAASDHGASPFVLVAADELPVDANSLTLMCAALLDTARGGSLLITDVEDMPAIVQNRLIETFTELQATLATPDRVRLMAGTTTSLHERVVNGTFSERLFYRLNTIHVVGDTALAAGVQGSTDRRTAAMTPCWM